LRFSDEWDESVAQFFGTAKANSYTGSVYQEAVSGVADIPAAGYIGATNARYVTYGFEYEPDFAKNGGGFITWYIDGKKTWTVRGNSIPARPAQNMARRLIPVEPMSIIMNLGISDGFQKVHFDELTFPAVMKVSCKALALSAVRRVADRSLFPSLSALLQIDYVR
jgi:beta-glucan synthesis-associated protein KRE6